MSAPIVTPRYRVAPISRGTNDYYDMWIVVNRRGEEVGAFYTKGMAEEIAAELNANEAE